MSEKIWIHPRFGPTLHAAGLCRLADFMSISSGHVLSGHKNRETLGVHLDNAARPTFYLKRVFRASFADLLKDVLHLRRPRSQPQREWSAIHKLQQHDIPVVGAVALGWETRIGVIRSAFILLEPAVAERPLTRYLLPATEADRIPVTSAQRAMLMRDLGRFLRGMHEAGIAWPDLDAKHIHVQPPGNARANWLFELIDVERLTVTASNRPRYGDLRRLWRSVPPTALSRTDLLRLAKAYTDESIRTTFRWATDEWKRLCQRVAKPVRLPTDFADLANIRFLRSGQVVYNHAFAPLLDRHDLHAFDAWLRLRADHRYEKPGLGSWRSRSRLTLPDTEDRTVTLHLKRFRHPPVREQLKRICLRKARESTAWYEWTQIKKLTAQRIPTMTPIAYGQRMIGPLERDSFLVTADIPGESLERWGPKNFQLAETDPAYRRRILRPLAHFVAAFHRAGFVHRDLYLSHIFLDRPGESDPVFRLIDLQRVFRPALRKHRWLVKDLAAMNFSATRPLASKTERMRFLRDYLPAEASRANRHRLAREVIEKTQQMADHNPQLQNPLDPIQRPPGNA